MLSLYVRWNVDPEIFSIFGIPIRYYGLLFGCGLLLCSYVLSWIFDREQIPRENLSKLFVYGFVAIFLGARLGHCLFYEPAYYFNHPLEILLPVRFIAGGGMEYTGFQGLASHGGTVGLIIAMILYSKRTKERIIRVLDIVAIVAPLGACFIRLANLMNSEIIGSPTDVAWAFIFERVDNIPRHPAQLYEAAAYLAIFVLLLFLYYHHYIRISTGSYFGISIALIFTARFFIEFLKERQVGFEEGMWLDMGQWLSIPLIVVAIGFVVHGFFAKRLPEKG